MATPLSKIHLFLLAFQSLVLLIQSNLIIDHSKTDAFNINSNHLQIPLLKSSNIKESYLLTRIPAKDLIPPEASKASISNSTIHKHNKYKRNLIRWIVSFVIGIIAGIISGLFFYLILKLLLKFFGQKEKEMGITIFSPLIKKAEYLSFLEKEEAVASLEFIDEGGCGKVYKAKLPAEQSNGKIIAIKKIVHAQIDMVDEDRKYLSSKMKQLRTEIQSVGWIRHRNILPLLAHVSRPDCDYLVYEFMSNGSLADVLEKVSKGEAEMNWVLRHRIAVGIATGLEYIHMNHNPRIIHRDLKHGNILLDDNMEAKIADFGLAKSFPDANTHVITKWAGTLGYTAPEYHRTLKLTDKCDIYSFGVVLAGLVTGRFPSNALFHEIGGQVNWIRNVMASENPKTAIDPKLLGNGYEDQMFLVLKIARLCTQDDPEERPNSKEVRLMLTEVTLDAGSQ